MKYLVTGQHGWLGGLFAEKIRSMGMEPISIEGDLADERNVRLDIDEDFRIVHFAGYKGKTLN